MVSDFWCASFEVCGQTWETEGVLRIHGHAFFKSLSKLRVWDAERFMWHRGMPHKAQEIMGSVQRNVGGWSGAYYVIAPKCWSLFVSSTKKPFAEFLVSPEWIFNLIQSGKMHYAAARAQFVRCGKGLVRRLQDLDRWHASQQESLIEVRAHATQLRLRQGLRAFRPIPAVDAWLDMYSSGVHARKRLLVLDGPSGMGKTEFVRSLFPQSAVLELNCAGLVHVCIPGFDALEHKCIFWDELSAVVVTANRKLFQHPAVFVDIGHSPTGQHVKKLWLNDSMSVIATNHWAEDVSRMESASDVLWLTSNCVVVTVDSPLFL